jgi:hypothetical protein
VINWLGTKSEQTPAFAPVKVYYSIRYNLAHRGRLGGQHRDFSLLYDFDRRGGLYFSDCRVTGKRDAYLESEGVPHILHSQIELVRTVVSCPSRQCSSRTPKADFCQKEGDRSIRCFTCTTIQYYHQRSRFPRHGLSISKS